MTNCRKYTVFTPRGSEVGKILLFCEKNRIFDEAPREKTVYFRELVMMLKKLHMKNGFETVFSIKYTKKNTIFYRKS